MLAKSSFFELGCTKITSFFFGFELTVKALNQARFEATTRAYGTQKIINKWPNHYIVACGFFLFMSLFQRFFHPLRLVSVAAVIVGLPPIVLRSIASIQRYMLDINILMLIAGKNKIIFKYEMLLI